MDDRRIKRNNNQPNNGPMVNMSTDSVNNNNMNNNTMNENIYSNMNNGMNNNNMNDNMNNGMFNNNMNNMNNMNEVNNNNSYNGMDNINTHTGYQEKQYKTGELEKNTVVTKASKISRVVLVGFYLLFIVIGAVVFFMLRADRYEFYLKNDSVSIYSGCYYQVELTPKNARYFDYLNYNYSIGDENIAKVDEFGKVTAVGVGTTTLKISLSPGFTSKTMKINVEQVEISSIDLKVYKEDKLQAGDVVNLKPDQSITLKAIANGRDDLNTTVKYTSSNPDVAFVDEFGNVTAKNEGTAVITGDKDGVTGSVTVSVKANFASTSTIENMSFAMNRVTIKKGNNFQLVVVYSPKDAPASFTWSSSNPSVANINNSGVVTGVENGQATITATSSNGLKTSCDVIITDEEIPVEKITLNDKTATLYVGATHQLAATLGPETATMTSITWTSNNESVATVNESGVVTGKAAGTAVITVSTTDGKVKAESKITVKTKPAATQKPTINGTVTKVSLGVSNQVEKYVGETLQVSASVEPDTVKNYSVKWSSSNSKVATVSQKGLIKAVKKGTAVITAEVGGVKGSVTVIVREKEGTSQVTPATQAPATPKQQVPPSTFNASYAKASTQSITINKGATATFKISIYNAAGVFGITSSNTGIATVDKATLWLDGADEDSGVPTWAEKSITVTGVAPGTTYIVVNMNDISTYDTVKPLTGQHTIAVTVK